MVFLLELIPRCDIQNVARDGRPLRLAGSVVRNEGRSMPYSQKIVNVLCKGRESLVRVLTFGWPTRGY